MKFQSKGDTYHGDGPVTCGGCGTVSTIPHVTANHSCPGCGRVLNGHGRSKEPDLS
ncbi:hypothetical protein [Nonomuraea typhae]|uniref:hypothetical protein n=1 Tax=Nonomuraea typhae TaxID=2603600 RepID=UPI0012FB5747|nr:hypothetical protein [Nonomuraea typhae]